MTLIECGGGGNVAASGWLIKERGLGVTALTTGIGEGNGEIEQQRLEREANSSSSAGVTSEQQRCTVTAAALRSDRGKREEKSAAAPPRVKDREGATCERSMGMEMTDLRKRRGSMKEQPGAALDPGWTAHSHGGEESGQRACLLVIRLMCVDRRRDSGEASERRAGTERLRQETDQWQLLPAWTAAAPAASRHRRSGFVLVEQRCDRRPAMVLKPL